MAFAATLLDLASEEGPKAASALAAGRSLAIAAVEPSKADWARNQSWAKGLSPDGALLRALVLLAVPVL